MIWINQQSVDSMAQIFQTTSESYFKSEFLHMANITSAEFSETITEDWLLKCDLDQNRRSLTPGFRAALP